MEYFTASLGVQCNFCHIQGQFDSDDNPRKDRARKMMAMVDRFNDSPANDVVITCATCHHGRVPPERTPTLAVTMTQAEADAAAAARAARGGGPGGGGQGRGAGGGQGGGQGRGRGPAPEPKPTETADAVIAKYVQALGGRAALAAAKSRVLEGAQTTRDLQTQPIKVQEKITGEYRIDIATTPNPTTRATSAAGTWSTGVGANPAPRDLEGIQAAQVARPTDFGLALNAKTIYSSFDVRRNETIDGKRTIMIDARRGPIVTESLYFDLESGLLLRRGVQTKTAYGNLAEQVDYSDYKDAGGIKVPFTIRYATWNQVTTAKFVDAKVNAQIDDAVFAKK
jgi:photosynthetic reaction center cytochrome c subunit